MSKEITSFYRDFREICSSTDGLFYRHYDEEFTYKDLWASMCKAAFALGSTKISTGLASTKNSKVAIFSDKHFVAYSAIFAIILTGNTWVPLNPSTPQKRLLDMLVLAKPNFIFTDRELTGEMAKWVSESGAVVISLQDLNNKPVPMEIETANIDPDDLAIIYFTSGSTGNPKGVKITHRNYIINVRNILRLVKFGESEVFGDYHDFGFSISIPILFPCVMTKSAVSPAKRSIDQIVPANHMKKNGVSVLVTVPSTIAHIRKMERKVTGFSDLNVLISCGEPLHLDIVRFALTQMIPHQMFNFYGSTEVAPWVFCHRCSLADLSDFDEIGYEPIGFPIEGNLIRVSNEGELLVGGPQVTPGYLGEVDSSRFFEEARVRWYRTGDLVELVKKLYICKGRLDSQVKLHGHRVELTGVEAHLRKMDAVETAICFTKGKGIEKTVFAVLITNMKYTAFDVEEFLSSRLPRYMAPRGVACLAEAPLNKSGKIDRAELKATFGGQE